MASRPLCAVGGSVHWIDSDMLLLQPCFPFLFYAHNKTVFLLVGSAIWSECSLFAAGRRERSRSPPLCLFLVCNANSLKNNWLSWKGCAPCHPSPGIHVYCRVATVDRPSIAVDCSALCLRADRNIPASLWETEVSNILISESYFDNFSQHVEKTLNETLIIFYKAIENIKKRHASILLLFMGNLNYQNKY